MLSRRRLWIGFLLYPTHTLPTAAAPVAVAAGLAAHDRVLAPWPLVVAFFGSWLIHLGGVFADQYELLRRHPDLPEHPELLQALRDGTLELRHLRHAVVLCFSLAALTAPYIVWLGGTAALAIGVLGVASSLFYAAGPWRYAPHGLADPVFFAMFGIVAVAGAYYVQSGEFTASALLLGLPVGALVTNVLVVDDIRDRDFDALKGWRTAAVRFGSAWSRRQYMCLSLLAYLAPFAFWLGLGYRAWVPLPLASLPWAVHIGRVVWASTRREALVPVTPRASLLALGYGTLLGLGLALS